MALARVAGSLLLKMPLPTKTDCAPSCMTSAASAGVAMPPAPKRGTGSSPGPATPRTRPPRDSARVFGDARVLGGDDVHDHAAAEHLGEPALDARRARRARTGHVGSVGHVRQC